MYVSEFAYIIYQIMFRFQFPRYSELVHETGPRFHRQNFPVYISQAQDYLVMLDIEIWGKIRFQDFRPTYLKCFAPCYAQFAQAILNRNVFFSTARFRILN